MKSKLITVKPIVIKGEFKKTMWGVVTNGIPVLNNYIHHDKESENNKNRAI